MKEFTPEDLATLKARVEADLNNPALLQLYEFAQRVESGEFENVILIGYTVPETPTRDCEILITSGFTCVNNHAKSHLFDALNDALRYFQRTETMKMIKAILPHFTPPNRGGH